MSLMSLGVATQEPTPVEATDTWRAPRRVLTILTSLARDGGLVLWRAGLPILTISLLAFLAHGWLIDRAARLAMDNGPLGLAVLIGAITVRLSALAWCLWLAADALQIDGRPLTQIRAQPDTDPAAQPVPRRRGRGRRPVTGLADGLRLVMAPMVIVYAAWNLLEWDIHSFLVAKQELVTDAILGTGVNTDQSNIAFASGGWKTYIPWAIGCWLVKVAIDRINARRDWRLLDVVIVYLECAWVILAWLVVTPSLVVARDWLRTRTLTDWWESAMGALSGISLPWDLSLPDLISSAWAALWTVVGQTSAHVLWPLLWLALIGLVVGWVTLGEITVGRTSGRGSIRNLSRVLDTSTRGLQEKWQPIWQVCVKVLRLGVVPLLTIALAYAALMVAAVWLRLALLEVAPLVMSTSPVLSDFVLRLSQALVDPLRIALLTGAFAFVVRESVRRGESR